jgi:Na+/proline symporter
MTTFNITLIFSLYALVIFLITYFTARGANTQTFFNAHKQAPWFQVAYGMVGVAISGMAFLSIPSGVHTDGYGYLQRAFGYLLGYSFIATVLLPIYYKYQLISIYSYLEHRFGFWSQKTGAFFFIISRIIRTGFNLFIVAGIMHVFVLEKMGFSFLYTVALALTVIFFYTLRGGINTIIKTDLLQTTVMLVSVGVMFMLVVEKVAPSFNEAMLLIQESSYSKAFFWDTGDSRHFFDQFFAGVFVAIVMNGLDQDIMQKNLSCRNLEGAQKNMFWFSMILLVANILMLTFGALVYLYADQQQIAHSPEGGLVGFITLLSEQFSQTFHIIFFLGLLAASLSSADSALISLTTSACVDFFDYDKIKTGEASKRTRRIQIHLFFTVTIFLMILVFHLIRTESVNQAIFKVASFTYGPLVGLYGFGILTRWQIKEHLVPFVCAFVTIVSYLVDFFSKELFNGYLFGYELVFFTGLLTFLGLVLLITPAKANPAEEEA